MDVHLAVSACELLERVFHKLVVEISPAMVSVAGDGHHLEVTLILFGSWIDVEEGDIKGTSTKIKDEHCPSFVADRHLLMTTVCSFVADSDRHLLKTICEGGGSWLIDDAHDV